LVRFIFLELALASPMGRPGRRDLHGKRQAREESPASLSLDLTSLTLCSADIPNPLTAAFFLLGMQLLEHCGSRGANEENGPVCRRRKTWAQYLSRAVPAAYHLAMTLGGPRGHPLWKAEEFALLVPGMTVEMFL
jgi:hypothetical protein